MGLPNTVNQLFNGGSPYYIVNRSLRFRASASAYLTRTPSVAGNNQKFTWSGWVKRGALGLADLFSAGTGDNNRTLAFFDASNYLIFGNNNSGLYYGTQTSAVFRDCSAWYHIIFSIDTTQATTANRVRLYVNGVEQTSTVAWNSGYIPQNTTTYVNATNPQMVGSNPTYGLRDYFDGYMAEVNFIDGQQLTPSSFGVYDSNGIWQPIRYAGTYGTNGFYLPFSNTTSTTTLVADASGNGNNWTPNNISLTSGVTYDSMVDSPTPYADGGNGRGNYAVLNPLSPSVGSQLSNGNLTSSNGGLNVFSTIQLPTSGKWYAEFNPSAVWNTGAYLVYGVMAIANASGTYSGLLATTNASNGGIYQNGSFNQAFTTWATTDVIGIAVDIGANTVQVYRNGSTLGTAVTLPSGDLWFYVSSYAGGNVINANFGQRPFTYTPPTGYNALNTANLPQPLISNGANYMAATLYTGTGSNITITNSQSNGGNNAANRTFYPDFVWTKGRSAATNNILIDSVRGGANYLISDSTSAEVNNAAAAIQSFSSTGYVMGTGGAVNTNGATYVGWQWKAGAGTTSTNTSGSITSTVSVSAQSGFSIATYTGTGANATVGHGLGVAPNMVIVKQRSGANGWPVYHSSLVSATNYMLLNQTDASNPAATVWNSTAPTSSVFSIGTAVGVNTSGQTYVAYCFAAVRGYSAFSSYSGNGSSDGPFCYLGFRPRYVMIKRTDSANWWLIWDSSRNTYNVLSNYLLAQDSAGENNSGASPFDYIDALSNGFKIRSNGISVNASGGTYIYAAFAENPFQISRAR